MARRADHTREELAELAIQAGLKRIREEGFSQFSIRKVATDIGYTVGTLYNVFGSYDEFILHINARTLDEWYGIMKHAMQNNKKDPLYALAKAYVAFSRSHYHQWSALFEHQLPQNSERPEWYLPKMTRFFTLAEMPLLELLWHNHAKTKRSARVLWAGIHGICVLSLAGKLDLVGADSPEVLAASFVETYLAGLVHAK
jgi:AcrR family transcriptional regulator